ncbi:MAG: M23 family metallopeptidase [Bacteroidetes bacterium]|uniref:M23 family metallopeptidase n=1 Tax=Phaeocystidibacter marisrubri TaxID=1577780 RepID=A0A6L3ZF90_9FLAO|nr:M23 family metallopeptidase [Phaeocystidibacter marisrubri]KAB2816521.1 M23 family metallopeptidase [Phaeocystidibacter marisrubri]TNE31004.1 MAG: M23 family metallopeptidase [Bacteroidota bacterium]GGH69475.1 peptidase M23 [Phaeocystidibacter marisrubri]
MDKSEKKKARIEKLRNKYRLVILNDDTFEEKISLKLSRLNVFLLTGLSIVLLISLTAILIAYTPLREYIPGYASTSLKRQADYLALTTDSLEQKIHIQQQYLDNIRRILSGDTLETPLADTNVVVSEASLSEDITPADSALRAFADEEDRFNLNTALQDINTFTFFAPVKGLVSGTFNPEINHLAVDVVAPRNTPIKACLDGVVLFADWTVETGHVIIVQHTENLISVYKHNSALLKVQGDLIQSGEALAIIGNSGEQSTGPHLHFELWHNGIPVDPQNYISF